MANTYFQFKQFIIEQNKCAMKVCTDSCIFGTSLPLVNATAQPIINVLDIGTGTGLLSLMYAQKNSNAKIKAIEIVENAYIQAKENVEQSIYNKQITVEKVDFLQYVNALKFDLIICNPPFYENDLQSNDIAKNIALHSTTLTLENLIEKSKLLLNSNGLLCILLPTKREAAMELLLEKEELFIKTKFILKQTEKHQAFRVIYIISKKFTQPMEQQLLTIKEGNVYSKGFFDLLKDYYLHF